MGTDLEKVGSEIPEGTNLDKSDSLAKQEQRDRFSGDERREEEHKEALHRAFLLFIRVMVYTLAVVMVIRFLHLVIPDDYCWLGEPKLKNLDNFLFSGTVGAVVANFLKRSFAMKPDAEPSAKKP